MDVEDLITLEWTSEYDEIVIQLKLFKNINKKITTKENTDFYSTINYMVFNVYYSLLIKWIFSNNLDKKLFTQIT